MRYFFQLMDAMSRFLERLMTKLWLIMAYLLSFFGIWLLPQGEKGGIATKSIMGYKKRTKLMLKGHEGTLRKVVVSKDGAMAATASGDHTARFWNLDTGECVARCGTVPENLTQGGVGEGHHHIVTCLAFSPDCKRIVTSSFDKTLRIWDLNGKCLAILQGQSQVLHCCDWSPSGLSVVSGAANGDIREWTLKSDSETFQTVEPSADQPLEFAFGSVTEVMHEDRHEDTEEFRRMTLRPRKHLPHLKCSIVSRFEARSGVLACSYHPQGSRLATTTREGEVRVWDTPLHSGSKSEALTVGPYPVVSCAFNEDGTVLAVGNEISAVVVLSINPLGILQTMRVGFGYVTGLCFHEEVLLLAAGSNKVKGIEFGERFTFHKTSGRVVDIKVVTLSKNKKRRVVTCTDNHVLEVEDLPPTPVFIPPAANAVKKWKQD